MIQINIIIAILMFGVLILVHEAGHFAAARLCGVQVNEFAIGMGPTLISRKAKKSETVFSLRLLPIGGFVSMSGEDEEGDLDIADIDEYGNVRKKAPLKTAVEFSEQMAERFSDLRVEYIHGKMKAADKDAVMRRFAGGQTDILVSTTVIEVGVNVPNASLMIVENADRFGLSQLHQLRGRVGRGKRKSYCVLVSDSEGENAARRLDIMRSTYDGYAIAERDLEMRGPGDFLKNNENADIRQSGGIRFKLAQLCDDTGLLKTAFSAAEQILGRSHDLADYPALASAVERMFTIDGSVMN